jgi:aminoglycoside phosphotransferase (APT) family kinase protein
LIVRFSKEPDPEQRAMHVRREAGVLAAVADVSPVAVPQAQFTAPEQGCLAYSKIPGVPLLTVPRHQWSAHAASIGAILGPFLSAIHALPADLLDTDDEPPAACRREAADMYRQVVAHVPSKHRPAVEAFLDAAPPDDDYALAFAHNDLGIEHVLVDGDTYALTGIIDWSDAAFADPAHDFGLLYRDLGPTALDAALGRYRSNRNDLERLRQRAVFYARCSVFEDLAYGLQQRQDRYVLSSTAALDWLFPAYTYE